VLISFGSFAQVSAMPAKTREALYNVLRSFSKIRFIWKWDEERPAEMPVNVMTSKWVPQQVLLGKQNL
jgi:hypothetical protein